MLLGSAVSDLSGFARDEFGNCDLGDARLNRRLVKLVEQFSPDPSRSIPKATEHWSQAKAAYRFMENERVTREKVLEPHYRATVERLGSLTSILAIQDSTFLNYTHHPGTEGLGNIGSAKQKNKLRGVMVHSCLAVLPGTHQVVGLLDQQVIVRKGYQDPGESSKQLRSRARESEKWLKGVQRTVERSGHPESLIFVFDREGDIFEAIEEIQNSGSGFVIRANQNRLLEELEGERAYLFDAIRQRPILARIRMTVPAGGGRAKREAELSLRGGRYRIKPPAVRKRQGSPREVNLVWILEENPPAGVKPLEWQLLTSERIETGDEASAVARHYSGRWKIEEWHKALKTGCQIESRQLETWDGLEVLLAIFSVIAWRLLALRDAARMQTDCPQEALSAADRIILKRLHSWLPETATPRQYLRAVAMLGGFLARKSDGDPGWMTLWDGFARLRDMRQGFDAASGLNCG
jgi:hypothetical protein